MFLLKMFSFLKIFYDVLIVIPVKCNVLMCFDVSLLKRARSMEKTI